MGVTSTSAPRSLIGTLQTLFRAPFSPVVALLVFADISNFSRSPEADFNPSDGPYGRNREFLLPNPSVERVPANTDKFRDFYSGKGRHLNNRIGLYGCQVKSETGAAQTCWLRFPRRLHHYPAKIEPSLVFEDVA